MSKRFIITAELRDLEKQVSLGEISYSRMVEILNEKADEYAQGKLIEFTTEISLQLLSKAVGGVNS